MSTPLTDVSGIGPSTAKELQAHGIGSAEDLASASLTEIMAVPGFGESRGQKVKETAATVLDAAEKPAEPAAKKREADPAEEKGKKKKEKKKGAKKEKKPKEEKKVKKKKGKKKK